MSDLAKFDSWLGAEGPAALVIREHLMPVEGADGVIFPPTFAPGDGFDGGYNIDEFPDGRNVCIVDTVGSQANRIEPIFAQDKYRSLVPQVVVKAGDRSVNLLDAGHRAGDAIVRCSKLKDDLQKAFKALLVGDAVLLAKIAPTSLVFGVWDSRDTQAKAPRLIVSTIRAYDVRRLTRSAQYSPAVDYVGAEILKAPEDLVDAEGKVKAKHPFAQRGFTHVPATATPGGVMATGGIRRDATLHLAALKLLAAAGGTEESLALRRYLLGLALVAFTNPSSGYLRQGCSLVLDPDKGREFVEVYGDGTRKVATVKHEEALAFAQIAAKKFVVGADVTVEFDTTKANEDLKESEKKPKRARARQ